MKEPEKILLTVLQDEIIRDTLITTTEKRKIMSITFHVENKTKSFTPVCPTHGKLGKATHNQEEADRIVDAHFSDECRYSTVRETKPSKSFSLDYNRAQRLLEDLSVSGSTTSGAIRYEALEHTLRAFTPREDYQVKVAEQLGALVNKAAKGSGWVEWSEGVAW